MELKTFIEFLKEDLGFNFLALCINAPGEYLDVY
jgi:hypothetical protein